VLDNKRCVSREKYVVYHKKNELSHLRVGVSVSSKLGNSVVRHKIKRQVVNMIDSFLNVDVPLDIVVIVRKKYLNNSYSENYVMLENILTEILKKEKI